MTPSLSKFQGSTNSDAEQRIGDLCAWIRQNCQRRITWDEGRVVAQVLQLLEPIKNFLVRLDYTCINFVRIGVKMLSEMCCEK